MATVADTATLYDEQASDGLRPFNDEYYKLSQFFGADYAIGPVQAMYSELASFAAGGGAGDTIQFMKLPNGTYILGGWLYTEDGLIADTNSADLGVVYEDGDGTDDVDCLADGIDVFDGADSGGTPALPAGSIHQLPQDVLVAPYKVDGGVGTVELLSIGSAFVTAKDVKLMLLVVFPA